MFKIYSAKPISLQNPYWYVKGAPATTRRTPMSSSRLPGSERFVNLDELKAGEANLQVLSNQSDKQKTKVG